MKSKENKVYAKEEYDLVIIIKQIEISDNLKQVL